LIGFHSCGRCICTLFIFLQLTGYEARKSSLLGFVDSSAYERQKSRLTDDFCEFLLEYSSRSVPPSLRTAPTPESASPDDVTKFLFFRDQRGRTQVHFRGCQYLGEHGSHPCGCATHLAAGTVDSMVGKLRAFFNSLGRVEAYRPSCPLANPCDAPLVKKWLKAASLEQRTAHVSPKQAVPLFSTHIRLLMVEISRRIALLPPSAPFLPDRYVLFRDRAFFAIQWWVGDRAGDLGRALGCEVTRLEDGSLLMNHTIGKTIGSSGDDLLVVPSLPDDALMCPVRALGAYVTVCKDNGVGVLKNFLFRPTSLPRHDRVSNGPFRSTDATRRLRHYLPVELLPSAFTAHGARAGVALTLLALGCSSEDARNHCRWASERVFRHYTRLSNVAGLKTTAQLLRDGFTPGASGVAPVDGAAVFFDALNSGLGQSHAF
jgi:hypothetical protein